MDQKQVLKQMMDFNKASFDNSFNAMVMIQDQAEKMVSMMLEQATWIPEEGRTAILNWAASYKSGRETFKKTVDENFKKVEEFFGAAAKPKK